jgi:hypothetical protein
LAEIGIYDGQVGNTRLGWLAAGGGRTQISLRNLRKFICVAIIDQPSARHARSQEMIGGV